MIPHRTPFFLPWLYRDLTWRMPADKPVLYLTFDDGPVPGPTRFVLDTLRSFSAKATFFCIGDNIKKHPDVFEEIVSNGHAIGNHTFNHLNGWKTPLAAYTDNIRKCDEVIGGSHVSSRLFRPPYGRITRQQIRALNDYRIVMWDVLSVDYNKNLSPSACLRNTIRAARPGSIVVFHDSYKAEKNLVGALPGFLDHFRSKGYSFEIIQ